jgi:hypothetical protein
VHRRRLPALLAALVLAAPASAFAQSAGDNQYQDPFGGGDQQQSQGGSGGGSGDQTPSSSGKSAPAPAPAPTATPAPPAPAPTATAAPVTTSTTTTTDAAVAPQLPRTGEDAGLLALGGAILLAWGVALRIRVSRADRA